MTWCRMMMSYDMVSHDDAQTVCDYTSDMSKHCQCDLLTCTNPNLSFDKRSQWVHLLSVMAVTDWPLLQNLRMTRKI